MEFANWNARFTALSSTAQTRGRIFSPNNERQKVIAIGFVLLWNITSTPWKKFQAYAPVFSDSSELVNFCISLLLNWTPLSPSSAKKSRCKGVVMRGLKEATRSIGDISHEKRSHRAAAAKALFAHNAQGPILVISPPIEKAEALEFCGYQVDLH